MTVVSGCRAGIVPAGLASGCVRLDTLEDRGALHVT